MNKNTVTTTRELAQGARFYRKADPRKIVYQKMEACPAHNNPVNPYFCCPIIVVDDNTIEERRKPFYYELIQAHEPVVYVGSAEEINN